MSTDLKQIVSELKEKVAALEAMVAAATGAVAEATKKKPGRPKKIEEEKAPKEMSAGMKAWHEFNTRIDTLLKTNEVPFKRVAEAKQFASKLKKTKAVVEWKDEEILAERETWAEEHKPLCPTCEKDVAEEPTSHSICARTFAAKYAEEGKGTAEEGMKEWTKLSGIAAMIAEAKADEPPAEKKKPGRPKMTEEQKAAAKVARELKTPEKPTKKVAPGAPMKPKVAWGGPEMLSDVVEEDLESVQSVSN
jgi:hypothetical protein